MNRILLVEDDRRLATLVSSYLSANGFEVTVEEHGDHVVAQVRRWSPDLIILDIMLPGQDGLDICRRLRPEFKQPVLLLTARDTDMDQIIGFESGADDYVIKPVEPAVLLARIKALLRRYDTTEMHRQELAFGQLKISAADRAVTLAGQPVALTSYEFDLLVALARSAGKVVSREYLFRAVCHRPYDGLDRSIDVRVSQLRRKLGDNPDNPFRIKTVWGRGYLFVKDAW